MSESYATQDKATNIATANEQLWQKSEEKCFKVSSHKGCVTIGTQAGTPDLRPCFEIRWGDSQGDQMETDDLEVLCLVASNPYSNVTLKDVTIIQIVVEMNNQEVARLPDGQHSVMITPSEMIVFGDLPPASTDHPTNVAREIVMLNKGAKRGEYKMKLKYCYTIEFALSDSDFFPLTLVPS